MYLKLQTPHELSMDSVEEKAGIPSLNLQRVSALQRDSAEEQCPVPVY